MLYKIQNLPALFMEQMHISGPCCPLWKEALVSLKLMTWEFIKYLVDFADVLLRPCERRQTRK